MADFRKGDALVSLGYGDGFLTKGIQWFQKEMLEHPNPAWRSTHVEVIVNVGDLNIMTFSQTFPKAKFVMHNRAYIQNHMNGDKPRYAIFRFHDYSNIVTRPFFEAMANWCKDKDGEGRGWKGFWGSIYDVGGLLSYPINWIARKFGHKQHIAWLEKTKANVCSDAVATAYRKGFVADDKQEDYIFDNIPSSEVAPSHFWVSELSKMFRVL